MSDANFRGYGFYPTQSIDVPFLVIRITKKSNLVINFILIVARL